MSLTFPHVVLVDLQPVVVNALDAAFEPWMRAHAGDPKPAVEVVQADFRTLLPADAVVTPANSFGLMDGGFDLAVSVHFGWTLQQSVQEKILTDFAGEQPIGTAFLAATGNDDCPFVIHAPTMRVPHSIALTLNVYYAMKAAVWEAVMDPRVSRILIPGLGTLSGHVHPDVAARQMELAYRHAYETWDALRSDDGAELLLLSQAEKWIRAGCRVQTIEQARDDQYRRDKAMLEHYRASHPLTPAQP